MKFSHILKNKASAKHFVLQGAKVLVDNSF